jgi:hypothetical protein
MGMMNRLHAMKSVGPKKRFKKLARRVGKAPANPKPLPGPYAHLERRARKQAGKWGLYLLVEGEPHNHCFPGLSKS